MITANQPAPGTLVQHIDQRVCLHGVEWESFEAVLAARGEAGGTRVT